MRTPNFHRIKNLVSLGRLETPVYHISSAHRMVYVQNDKVACTSIKSKIYPDLDVDEIGLHDFHQKAFERSFKSCPIGLDQYLWFTFVRDPVTRLISAYKHFTASDHEMENHHTMDHPLNQAIFLMTSGRRFRKDLCLDEFLDLVESVPNRFRDRHIVSQCYLRHSANPGAGLEIFKFENLDRDWDTISQATGIGKLPHKNASIKARRKVQASQSQIDRIRRILDNSILSKY